MGLSNCVIVVNNVDAAMKAKFKAMCAIEGTDMSTFIKELLKQKLKG